MNEQEDIKALWQKADEGISQQQVPSETLEKVKHSKPHDLIERFRKTIRYEILINAILYASLPLFLIGQELPPFSTLDWVLLILFYSVTFGVYFFISVRALNRINRCKKEYAVKDYLQNVIKVLQSFVAQYRLQCLVLMPLATLLGLSMGLDDASLLGKKGVLFALIISGLLIVGVGLLICELYIWLVYRRQIKRIRKILSS